MEAVAQCPEVGPDLGPVVGEEVFILLMALGRTISEAAAESHVHIRTAYRRLQEPAVVGRIEATRKHFISLIGSRFALSGERALQRLEQVLHGKHDGRAIDAARVILSCWAKLIEAQGVSVQQAAELPSAVHALLPGQRTATGLVSGQRVIEGENGAAPAGSAFTAVGSDDLVRVFRERQQGKEPAAPLSAALSAVERSALSCKAQSSETGA